MKTAMQELEEKLKDNLKQIVLNADYELMDKLFIQGLEKAFNDGHHADVGHIDKAWEYYNQTYNKPIL
jgi:hypothetical protein